MVLREWRINSAVPVFKTDMCVKKEGLNYEQPNHNQIGQKR